MQQTSATVSATSPPTYLGGIGTNTHGPSELPGYTRRRRSASVATSRRTTREERVKEFQYDVQSRGRMIACMTVLADGSYSKHLPTFLQGSSVKGRIYLGEEKLNSVQSIFVTVQGKIIHGADPNLHQIFFEVNHPLWSSGDSPPPKVTNFNEFNDRGSTNGADSSGTSTSSGFSNFRRHANGRQRQEGYSWDFSMDIPQEASFRHGSKKQTGVFSLPETFTDRTARCSISYEVSARFVRGKWQTDYRIPAVFGYMPITRPPPFSTLRQLCYQENVPLLGPTVDLEGWHRIDPISLRGTLFNNRDVNIKCTLFLAKPLSYTRGSLIPLSLCLQSEDQQGLDLLSSPRSIVIRLRRRIQYHFDPANTVGAHYLRDSVDFSERAILWPSTDVHPSSQVRYLNGELHIKADTKPTSSMGDFRIEYTVVLQAFEASGFEPSQATPLIEQSVDIVSFFAPGPRPKKYAPPGYSELLTTRTDFCHPDVA